jgi:hypothetical protein
VILLSVLTLTTLAFLSMSRRERGAVTTTTDTASARLAADAALANAEGQILANALATTNPYNFGLLVSTNYISGYGYNPAAGANPTNVNYDYRADGQPFTPNDRLQNLENLYYSPRPPMFIGNDFRFYLDLNRNGKFEDTRSDAPNVDNFGVTNGTIPAVGDPEWIGVLQRPDQPYGPNNPFVARFAFIALPIGNTLDLNAIHDQAHRGLPSLPINSTVNPPTGVANSHDDIFIRNEGVGSWEINLAAFLADLNTNQWGQVIGTPANGNDIHYYYQYLPYINHGYAFDDARALLAYRYNNDFNTLNLAQNLFAANAAAFGLDPIDGFTYGLPLMTGFQLPGENDSALIANGAPWAGADNTNHFFTHQELFDPNKTQRGVVLPALGFTDHLLAADNGVSTYDRYTFYRLLSQLGTDSAPEQNKINLNYRNVINGVVVPNLETNFYPWTAIEFFTNAADKMLRDYSQEWLAENPSNYVATFNITNSFGITNIPVLIGIPGLRTNFVYSPAIQRVLQLAANIYDATTNNTAALGTNFPSVFRPIFEHDNSGNVFITGYTNLSTIAFGPNTVAGPGDPQLALPHDVANVTSLSPNFTPITDASGIVNVYGVPWIIGAKKGFPNFNEFYMESTFQITRKLMVTRSSTNVPAPAPDPSSSFWNYYEMFNLSISNQFGVECWNSYTNNYTRPIGIYVNDDLTMILTNDENFSYTTNLFATGSLLLLNLTPLNPWQGYNPVANPLLAPLSFKTNFPDQFPDQFNLGILGTIPTNFAAVPVSRYLFNGGLPYLSTNLNLWYETGPNGEGQNDFGQYPQPHWWLTMTNNLQVIILDIPSRPPWHVIDYVQLRGPSSIRDLTAEILKGYDTVGSGNNTGYNDLWDTNLINGVPNGFSSQFNVSQGNGNPTWNSKLWGQDEQMAYDQINAFIAFTMGSSGGTLTYPGYISHPGQIAAAEMTNAIQMAYTPTATVVQDIVWQANDPLVHYMASDLINPTAGNGLQIYLNWPGNLGKKNQRYRPWGAGTSDAYNLALKDPLMWQSDDWDFPTYKFPTIGWLGRVHRGTPWQTVYLKAANILANNGLLVWMGWTGNGNSFDATNTAPVQDRLLFDLFTTAFNDNATRGTLSVNVGANDPNNSQAGLAAWSALFSGVVVPTSLTNSYTVINPAGPAGASSALGQIVTNINQKRTNFVNVDGLKGTFEHAGDILATPALTTQSPFLNWNDPNQQANGINDEMYEWLPQQVMSLLRVGGSPQTPMRYVIYSYGQALKPAPSSIYTGGGQFFGMITNYQVVSETTTRAVVRFGSTLTNVVGVDTSGALTVTNRVINNNAVIESFNVLPSD